jgi:hypothetical protein
MNLSLVVSHGDCRSAQAEKNSHVMWMVPLKVPKSTIWSGRTDRTLLKRTGSLHVEQNCQINDGLTDWWRPFRALTKNR